MRKGVLREGAGANTGVAASAITLIFADMIPPATTLSHPRRDGRPA